ncbi:pseudouridine synthase [Tissierella creatinophila]|uniref:Pseudouridine synthase n=1 Tax=Tissierella creatinophila DSM 6911 TaxID=1123403 RepID=A0A1U7M6I5_TISCR|nr:pseudouridine synthase [Tissierella creatinophila]OLS02808.1 ribosomal small subunit pseudouridine synthase A [Tissierella creatinophila DSM 6911]
MSGQERLDKVLSNMGYGSRKEIKKIIKDGSIKVNNEIVLKNDIKVDPYSDEIYFHGEKVIYRKYIYLMMNKPKGLVSSTDDPLTDTVISLLSDEYLIYNPFPAGRLDKDTEGFMLITNDGKLSHELLSPKKRVSKTYYVEVDGVVEEEHKENFKNGIRLEDGYISLPAKLEIIKSDIISSDIISKVYLTIEEGKYHQVKRMFESLSMRVLYLKRISMGPLSLDESLDLGEYRELTNEEVFLLKNI